MARTSEYQELKQRACELHDHFQQLPANTPHDELRRAYEEWLHLYESAIVDHFAVESLDDLEEFAGEAIDCIQKCDAAYEAHPAVFQEQPIGARKLYKEADRHVYELSKAKGWRPLCRSPHTLLTIDELRAIQKWCLERRQAVEENKANLLNPLALNDTAQLIIVALGNEKLKGEAIARKAKCHYNSHFKSTLAHLHDRGILGNTKSAGYFLIPEYYFLLHTVCQGQD